MTTRSTGQLSALKSDDAADYLGISRFTLRNIRQADARAIAQGKQPRGPKFIRIGTNLCLYRRSDLDKWLDSKAKATVHDLKHNASAREK